MCETNFTSEPLHNLNPLNRFSNRASDYAKYRPSYPAVAIDIILNSLGKELLVADIGAGTGISSQLLAERGLFVLAIEPNAAMREAAISHPLIEFRDGKAEYTQLKDASVDVVTCFQAFHWFDPEPTLLEFKRILSNTGRLALVWNNDDKDDAFTNECGELAVAASTDKRIPERFDPAQPLLVSPHFTNVQNYTFTNSQALDLPSLIGLLKSHSHMPREGLALEQLILDLESLFHRFKDDNGLVSLRYVTTVYLAEPSI